MKTKILTSAVVFGLCSAVPALAQDYYGSVFGGLTQNQNTELTGEVTPPGGQQSVDVTFDDGYNFGAAVGRSFGTIGSGIGLRGELELSFGESDADELFFSGNGPAAELNVSGDINTTRLFANALFDFETGSALTPYLGAGLGVAFKDIDILYGPGVALEDNTTDFSAQVIAGSSYALSDTTSLFGDVRYIRDFGTEVDRLSPAGGLTGVVEDDFDTVAVNIGVRFTF